MENAEVSGLEGLTELNSDAHQDTHVSLKIAHQNKSISLQDLVTRVTQVNVFPKNRP